MQRLIKRGAAANSGLIFHVFAQDSASTSGAGKASIAYSSWTCYYIRAGEAISGAITPQDIATIGTYAAPTANTNIRIKAVDNTNMIGVYEIQLHLDWVNTTNSCQSLTIYLTATGVAVLPVQIPLVAYDPQSATDLGLSRINDTITSRASQTSLDTLDDYVDTEVGAIKAKTDNLPASPAAVSDIPSAASITTAVWAAATRTLSAFAFSVTVGTNSDKTGYTLTTGEQDAIVDKVWNEPISGHLTGGTTGAVLNGAGSAGDPWLTALPGAYSAGTAGKILGDNLNATVSSRATQTSVDTVDDFLDTEITAIKNKTDNLPASPAAVSDIPSLASIVSGVWAAASRTLSAFGFTVTTDVSSTVTTNLNATVSSRATPADVITSVDNALNAAQTEAVSVPTGTGSIRSMIQGGYAILRNKFRSNKTTGEIELYNELGSSLATGTFTDDGNEIIREKLL